MLHHWQDHRKVSGACLAQFFISAQRARSRPHVSRCTFWCVLRYIFLCIFRHLGLDDVGRGTFATVKEGTHKETKQRVAVKIIDKKDAVFDAESLAQEVRVRQHLWA